jgi:acetate kinase
MNSEETSERYTTLLVINCGSSLVKFKLYDVHGELSIAELKISGTDHD